MNMDMNQEKNQKNRNPHHDGGSMLAQVQASVEILSPVPVGCKCGEKDYERLFIHDAPRDCIIQAEDNLHIIFTDGSLYIHIRLVTHLPIRKDDAVLDLGLCNSSFPHIRRNIY